MKWGSHVLKAWSITQNVIALSSGEAEFYAMVKTASQSLGMQAMMHDLGIYRKHKGKTGIKLLTDASAAKGMAQRKGLGTVRHLETNQLWVQDRIARGDLLVEKIGGKKNIADALTKYVDAKDLAVHVEGIGLEFRDGRHQDAPEVAGDDVIQVIDWGQEDDNDDALGNP